MYSTEELMNELDYFYEPIPHIYNRKEKYFVYLKEHRWQVIKDNNIVLETRNHMDVLMFLVDKKADLNEFDRMMAGCIKTKYIYIKSKMAKIEKIFTTEELVKAEEDMEAFKKSIVTTLKKQVSGLKVIKGGV